VSVRIMTMVWDGGPSDPTDRFVLLAMADMADDDGKCWPSVARIAQRCCMSERNARRIIRKLELAGWVLTQVQPGRNQTNRYQITKPDIAVSARTDCPPGQMEHENRTNEALKPDIAVSARTDCPPGQMEHENRTNEALKPDIAVSAEPSRTVKNHQTDARVQRFDEFWEAYPHRGGTKKGRKPAFEKYRIAVKRGIPEQTIIDGAKRSVSDRSVRDGFARDPATWLHQEGWTDEVAPAGASPPQGDTARASQLARYERIARQQGQGAA